MKWFGSRVFTLYVAVNMLVCALLFFPWARPRETVSGLIGRWRWNERGWKQNFARRASRVVNSVYFWEPSHCDVTHEVEQQAHTLLYPPRATNGSGVSKAGTA
jgi:hypothetical protein